MNVVARFEYLKIILLTINIDYILVSYFNLKKKKVMSNEFHEPFFSSLLITLSRKRIQKSIIYFISILIYNYIRHAT